MKSPPTTWEWALTIDLRRGLRAAVVTELQRRGRAVPHEYTVAVCRRRDCRSARMVHRWYEDSLGRRQILRSCAACGERQGFAPRVEPYVSEADAAASPTAVLDVLVLADMVGVALRSDGQVASVCACRRCRQAGAPESRVELLARLEECRSRLGRIMGRTP
jgi:hypothetical protein